MLHTVAETVTAKLRPSEAHAELNKHEAKTASWCAAGVMSVLDGAVRVSKRKGAAGHSSHRRTASSLSRPSLAAALRVPAASPRAIDSPVGDRARFRFDGAAHWGDAPPSAAAGAAAGNNKGAADSASADGAGSAHSGQLGAGAGPRGGASSFGGAGRGEAALVRQHALRCAHTILDAVPELPGPACPVPVPEPEPTPRAVRMAGGLGAEGARLPGCKLVFTESLLVPGAAQLHSVEFRIRPLPERRTRRPAPPHLVGALSRTKLGRRLLLRSGLVHDAALAAMDGQLSDLRRRAAVWTLGHCGSCPAGLALLLKHVSPDIVVRMDYLARDSSSLALRCTALQAMSLMARSGRGRAMLQGLGWVTCDRDGASAGLAPGVPGQAFRPHIPVQAALFPTELRGAGGTSGGASSAARDSSRAGVPLCPDLPAGSSVAVVPSAASQLFTLPARKQGQGTAALGQDVPQVRVVEEEEDEKG